MSHLAANHSQTPGIWAQMLEKKTAEARKHLAPLERKRINDKVSTVAIVPLEAVKLQTIEAFQASINQLTIQFAHKDLQTKFLDHLSPTLERICFLEAAASTASGNESTASLVWGLLFAVVQCACVFSNPIEDVIRQLRALQRKLPSLDLDMSQYASSTEVQYLLRDVFEDYSDYCLLLLRLIAVNPLKARLQNMFGYGLGRKLRKITQKLSSDSLAFCEAVQKAEPLRPNSIKAGPSTTPHAQLAGVQKATSPVPLSNQIQAPAPSSNQVHATVNSVTITENPDFFGREAELDTLFRLVVTGHQEPKPFAFLLHGRGGVGKSQVALKFTYQRRANFNAVFWVSADPTQETETLRTFGNIGRRLKLFQDNEIRDTHVDIVLEWLQTTYRWLLVFDNVDDRKSLARYWPTQCAAPSVILMTSQALIQGVDYVLEIEPLDDMAGSQFLINQMHVEEGDISDEQQQVAVNISKELGGSPLFLSHAEGFMALSGCSLNELLHHIQTGPLLSNKSSGNWQYERALSAIHDNLLRELTPGAMDLLFMIIFMNPDDISEDLLLSGHMSPDLEFLSDKSKYMGFIAELGRGRLVQRDTDGTRYYLCSHRITQMALLHRLNDNVVRRDAAFNRMMRLLREHFPPPSPLQIAEASMWPRLTQVLPHVLSALKAFERASPSMTGDMFLAELLCDVGGMDLYDRGRILEAYRINQTVGKILDRLRYPLATPLRGDALAIMGICTDFMALSKRQEGLKIREMQQKIRKLCFANIPQDKVTHHDKVRLYNSYTDLVCSQQQINSFSQVRENLEECLIQYKLWGSEQEHPYEYSKYYNQMAYVLLYENQGQEAVAYSKKGYELVEEATPDTGIVALYKFDYANILFQKGESQQEALTILRELLTRSKVDCGKDNVRTLEIRLNIGIMSYFLGDFKTAEKQIRKAIDLGEEKVELWPEENSVRGRYYLSQVLKNTHGSEAAGLEMEVAAKDELEILLKLDLSGKYSEYRGNYPMLFDYLVHWECRLVTPRIGHQVQGEVGAKMVDTPSMVGNNPGQSQHFLDVSSGGGVAAARGRVAVASLYEV